MSARLTWMELAALPEGTRLVFAEAYEIVPAGTQGVLTENGLNEIWCAMLVTPDDAELREQATSFYGYEGGGVRMGHGLDPGGDRDGIVHGDIAWDTHSPLALPAAADSTTT